MKPWLIGCEESGTVRDAFLARGIPAASCAAGAFMLLRTLFELAGLM